MSYNIHINQIDDNPWQVREVYDPAYIDELASDIRKNGLLQPPIVRMNNDWAEIRYELAFGHCRFRAWKLLYEQYGLEYAEFPTDLRELTDEQMADFAWTENEQRRNVTPIERMHAIKKQMETFGWSQKEIADRRGLSESTVSNILRLGELPKDVQDRVHKGELSERAAVPLIGYFSLPESIREAAAKKTYIESPIKMANEGRSSDQIRNAVKYAVQQTATVLAEAWDLDQAYAGEGIISPTCSACANHFMFGNGHYCGEQSKICFNAKKKAARLVLIQEAHETTGIAVWTNERITKNFYSDYEGDSLHPRDGHPGILAQGCEHLRLREDSTANSRESLPDVRFHGAVSVVCCNPDVSCTCAKAMILAIKQAKAENDPAEKARLQAQADEQARKERQVNTFRNALLLPTGQAFMEKFSADDVAAWRVLIGVTFGEGWETIGEWSLEECKQYVIRNIASKNLNHYLILERTDEALDRVNRMRTRLGLESLTLPEDPHATPAEKLERRLTRIEGWMERTADGEEEITAEAVRGNLANLQKILEEYAGLPNQTPSLAERVGSHIEALEAWLLEYDAESDEEDDEQEELDGSILQAYIGEATPA